MPRDYFDRRSIRAASGTGCAFAICLLTVACNGDTRFKPAYPVTGRIMYEGKPPVGADVYLYPLNGHDPWAQSKGVVGEDGSFAITTYAKPNDGAPAGDYALLVSWRPPAGPGGVQQELEKVNKLPMKYWTLEGSPVPKFTVTDRAVDLGEVQLTKSN